MTSDGTTAPPPERPVAPPPLQVATALAGVEALLLGGYGVAELAAISQDRVALGLTTGAFLLLYGGGLAWCAWQLYRLQSWARSPVVFAQLIQLGVAWSFRADPTTVVAVALAVPAVVTIAGVLHPQSLRALSDT